MIYKLMHSKDENYFSLGFGHGEERLNIEIMKLQTTTCTKCIVKYLIKRVQWMVFKGTKCSVALSMM